MRGAGHPHDRAPLDGDAVVGEDAGVGVGDADEGGFEGDALTGDDRRRRDLGLLDVAGDVRVDGRPRRLGLLLGLVPRRW